MWGDLGIEKEKKKKNSVNALLLYKSLTTQFLLERERKKERATRPQAVTCPACVRATEIQLVKPALEKEEKGPCFSQTPTISFLLLERESSSPKIKFKFVPS